MESINIGIRDSIQKRNATEYFYYLYCKQSGYSLCKSFDIYKQSKSYTNWLNLYQEDITRFVLNQNKGSNKAWKI